MAKPLKKILGAIPLRHAQKVNTSKVFPCFNVVKNARLYLFVMGVKGASQGIIEIKKQVHEF